MPLPDWLSISASAESGRGLMGIEGETHKLSPPARSFQLRMMLPLVSSYARLLSTSHADYPPGVSVFALSPRSVPFQELQDCNINVGSAVPKDMFKTLRRLASVFLSESLLFVSAEKSHARE